MIWHNFISYARTLTGTAVGGVAGAVVGAAVRGFRDGRILHGAIEGAATGVAAGMVIANSEDAFEKSHSVVSGLFAAAGALKLMNEFDDGGVVYMASMAASLVAVNALKFRPPSPYDYKLKKRGAEAPRPT